MSKESENTGEYNESKGFDLPKDYFSDFSASVLNKIEWIKEHKEFPLLEKMKGSMDLLFLMTISKNWM